MTIIANRVIISFILMWKLNSANKNDAFYDINSRRIQLTMDLELLKISSIIIKKIKIKNKVFYNAILTKIIFYEIKDNKNHLKIITKQPCVVQIKGKFV